MTLPPTVSESVRYHATRACSDIVGRIYSCAKPIYFNCLFPTIIKRILTRIVTRYILINRIVLRCAYTRCCAVQYLALHWHINTIADCAFSTLARTLY